jgi:predicted AlkP superfamily pyrophosphatase or phosphodiesterase
MRTWWSLRFALFVASACSRPAPAPVVAGQHHEPAGVAAAGEDADRAIDRVVIVSVDGLRPADCASLPTLGSLARAGAFAAPPDGALSVVPTVTYPAHTTMVTGVNPGRHGITTNHAPNPSGDPENDSGWRWYREDLRVPTLYDAALDAGLRTVLLQWPVTVGARATALLPEFWVPHAADDVKVVRQLATPGLFDQVSRRFPGFAERYTPDKVLDAPVIDAAIALLADVDPHLMLVHIFEVDSVQHEFGPDTPEADAARRNADTQVARLLDALRATPAWPRTVLVVVSDHGFMKIAKLLAPYVHLDARGLKDRVEMNAAGGFAYFYLRSHDDADAAALTRQLFVELARDPASGVGAVLERDAIIAIGGDPEAFLAIEATPGFAVSSKRKTAVFDSKTRGMHGYLPERAEMRATLLFYGPKVAPGVLHAARLVDLAPTVARWLGLALERTDGAPLAVTLSSDR